MWWLLRFYLDRSHNKVVGAFEMHVRGFRFVVYPDAFCIHRWEDPDFAPIYRRPSMLGHATLYNHIESDLRERYHCEPADLDQGTPGTCADAAETPTFKFYYPYEPIQLSTDEAEEQLLHSSFKNDDNEDEFVNTHDEPPQEGNE